MNLLDRYIAKTVLSAMVLITIMLTGLQMFIMFVNQIGELGRNDYGITQAIFFTLLQLPYEVYLFFPMASLLGCLLGLGVMANHSELVIMRASGMSIGQITGAVLKVSLVITLVVTLIGETLVPVLSHYGNDYKSLTSSGGQSLRTAQGMWLRFDNDLISIGGVFSDTELEDVYQFRFDTQHNLVLSRFIHTAKFINNQWTAYGIKQTEFKGDRTEARVLDSIPWDVPIKPKILRISSANPHEMTLRELNRYLRDQPSNSQNVRNYQLTFLQRIIQPLTTMVMMLLAIPFIFGPLRSSTMGARFLVGTSVGFGFYTLNHFVGPVSLVFQWPIVLAAFGPTFIFALFGFYLIRRV